MSTVSSASLGAAPKQGLDVSATSAAVASPSDKPFEKGVAGDTRGAADIRSPLATLTKAELASQVQELQIKMDRRNPALAFVLDESSGRALIQLTDRNTKEVIQQFPAEAALQISKELDRFAKGHLLHKMV